jgi:hypothetical protein
MFRRTAILGLSLALGAAAPLVLAVDAEAPATAALAPAAATPADAGTQSTAPPAEGRKTAVPPKFVRSDCTGTRIRASAGKPCGPSSTLLRSYSQEDLQRTGQIQVGDALRLLDPIFR